MTSLKPQTESLSLGNELSDSESTDGGRYVVMSVKRPYDLCN